MNDTKRAKRILVVDDEADFRELLAFSLRRRGYEVLLAASGNEALQFLKLNPVDVLISDIRMPNGDGLSLLDEAKKFIPNLPAVLLMTGFSEVTLHDAIKHGAGALFSKPFDMGFLAEAIQGLLDESSAEAPTDELKQANVKMCLELSEDKHLDGRLLKLTDSGMVLEVDAAHGPNVTDHVGFHVCTDGFNQVIRGSGIVRWARMDKSSEGKSGIKVEFQSSDPGFADRIRAAIRQLQKHAERK